MYAPQIEEGSFPPSSTKESQPSSFGMRWVSLRCFRSGITAVAISLGTTNSKEKYL